MERKERRGIGRVKYRAEGIAVVCDTQQVIRVEVLDIGPSGAGVRMPAETPELVGKDLILLTDTMILYVDLIRQEREGDGSWRAGMSSRKFSQEVLQYLFDSIETKAKYEAEGK